MVEQEIRNYSFSEVRACDKDKRTVEGYAAVFNSESQDLGGFIEVIDRNAFDGVIEKSDVFALLNHSNERGILARSKNGAGTLTLSIDDRGLKYVFEAPNTALGDEVLEYLRRGDIDSSSFAFTVSSDTWERRGDGYLRTINQIDRLFDVSPVFTPAYQATSVGCRSFDEFKEQERLAEEKERIEAEERAKAEELKKEEELHAYYEEQKKLFEERTNAFKA